MDSKKIETTMVMCMGRLCGCSGNLTYITTVTLRLKNTLLNKDNDRTLGKESTELLPAPAHHVLRFHPGVELISRHMARTNGRLAQAAALPVR